jgi:tetratricopeptide (TPR) repeat protein
MTNADDGAFERERWAAIVAAEARGEPVSHEDAEHRRRFEEDHPEAVKEEGSLWAGLGALGDRREGEEELSDAALLQRVLARASAGEAAPELAKVAPLPPRKGGMRRGVAGIFAGVAFAAALAALAAEILSSRAPEPPPGAPQEAAPSVGAVAPLVPRGPRGGAPSAAEEDPASDPAPSSDAPEKAADLSPGAAPGAAPGAVNEKERAGGAGGHAGAPRESADDLLKEAQARLGEGRTADAVTAYKTLLERYPSSGEARAALVSLGRLSLSGGSAAEALGYFERYLAGAGGPLRVEARYGRIQALRRLGRAGDELTAIQEFLAAHGESVYAARLRERALALAPASASGPASGSASESAPAPVSEPAKGPAAPSDKK